MGCDIHLHIEIKVGGQWEHYAAPHCSRSYAMFGKMAGVRRPDAGALVEPRGLPDDVSKLTDRDAMFWADDAHNHSWLSAAEIADLSDFYQTTCGDDLSRIFGLEGWVGCYLYGNTWAGFHRYPESREPWVEDVRFVFWFDN
jgi:hypothetical protein